MYSILVKGIAVKDRFHSHKVSNNLAAMSSSNIWKFKFCSQTKVCVPFKTHLLQLKKDKDIKRKFLKKCGITS